MNARQIRRREESASPTTAGAKVPGFASVTFHLGEGWPAVEGRRNMPGGPGRPDGSVLFVPVRTSRHQRPDGHVGYSIHGFVVDERGQQTVVAHDERAEAVARPFFEATDSLWGSTSSGNAEGA